MLRTDRDRRVARLGVVVILTSLVAGACTSTDAIVAEQPPATSVTASTTAPTSSPTSSSTTSPTTSPTTGPPTTPAPTVPPSTSPDPTTPVSTPPPGTTPTTTAAAPDVDAAAYAVYDATADRWLATRDADTPRAVGSVMKLLTAYVVMQAGDPAHVVTVPEMLRDPEESAIGLYAGERQRRDVLLRAMLIVSANDAARALAIDLAGSEEAFAVRMNEAAAALGLHGTVAVNAVGLDAAGAGSTARDVVTLAATLLRDPTFRETAVRQTATLHGQTFPATNDLLGAYDGATGVKSGRTTQAGWCLVGSAERGGRAVIVAVLGASSDAARLTSTTVLLDWAFAQP